MRRTILIASGSVLILGLLGLVMVFGSALAQPIFRNGPAQAAQQDDSASCHIDGGEAASGGHMLGPLAKALGMSEAELGAALDAGEGLPEIAKARGYDDAKLAAALDGAMREAMQQHVQEGILSQSQADEMLKHMDQMGPDHMAGMLNGQMPADMKGHDHGGMMNGLDHGGMMDGSDHGGMMGGPNHGGMMNGSDHGGMMGGQGSGSMMDGIGGDEGGSGACHVDGNPVAQSL